MQSPSKRAWIRPAVLSLTTVVALAVSADFRAAPEIDIIRRPRLALIVSPITAGVPREASPPPYRLELEGKDDELRFDVLWPDPGESSTLHLRAAEQATLPGHERSIRIDARLRTPDGREVTEARTLGFSERSTTLFEVFRIAGKPLTVAIDLDVTMETRVSPMPVADRPVLLRLEIQRVDGESTISLETNDLRTLVGRSTSYSFRLGSLPESEAAEIRLRPLRVVGELIELQAQVSGTLPDGERVTLAARNEQWVITRGTTSALSFETGEPPQGYRFLVTPDF
ncbi:MAG: hypothetical protein GY716_10390 [bacterium]|nr:hypothetical protein [bacterium]